MTLKRQIAYNTILQMIGKILSTLLGLSAVLIMTRSLGAEKFGWYITAVGFLQFIGIFSDFGFMITSSNLLSEPKFEKKDLLDVLFTWRFITALIFQGLSPLLFLFFPYPHEIKLAVAIIAVSFFATSITQVFNGYFQMRLQTHFMAIGELISRIVLLLGVYFLSKNNSEFLPIMIIISIASILNALYLYWHIPTIKFNFDKTITKAIFIRLWPTALCIIFNSFYLQGDRVILPLYATQSDVGFYGAAYRVLDIIIQMSAMIMGLMSPLLAYSFSRARTEEFKERLQMSFDLMILFLTPLMIGAIVLSEPIMRFVGGNEFIGAGKILSYLSWAILGICFGIIFGYTALAINKQKQAIWIYAADAVLSIAGYFIFIPRFGIYGAAGVTIFSEIFAGFMLMSLVFYHSKFLPNLKTILKIIIAGLIMSAGIQYIPTSHVLWSIILGGIIYSVMIILLKTISKQTIKEIMPIRN